MTTDRYETGIYTELDEAGFKVLVDLMLLPQLFGIWITNPKYMQWVEEQTGEKWVPKAYLFLGQNIYLEIDFIDDDENHGDVVTLAKKYLYELDNSKIYVERAQADDDNRQSVSEREGSEFDWFLTIDGCLNFIFPGESVIRYSPATIDDLLKTGFDEPLIKAVIKALRENSVNFKETFDLNTAYELIDTKLSKQEDEEGMERGSLGRPDPTTWVFGEDRYTGPVPPPVGKG